MSQTVAPSGPRINGRCEVGFCPDALDLIKAEHHEILKCFDRVGGQGTDESYVALVQNLCDRLTVYLSLKEEIVIPTLERRCSNTDLKEQLDESVVEHFTLRVILDTLDGQGPEDELFQAKLTMLQRQFIRHVGFEAGFFLSHLVNVVPDGLGKSLLDHKQKLLKEFREE